MNELFSGRAQFPAPRYTNTVSNTNLFSAAEQKLLADIPLRYRSVTTNFGPSGTVLVSLTNSGKGLVATFRQTSTDTVEEIAFGGMKTVRVRSKSNNGYDVDLTNDDCSILNFRQIKGGVVNGLFVSFYEGHVASWMRFEDGKAVGKWLAWGRGNTLVLEAEFKQPYDYFNFTPQRR
ncbi:MAG TPA: hypothetical protein VFZ59_09665 [Verrucomicrobiae bacterium]|nr:hypothetical protein [Verrucomicrobiae bacterium]